VSKATKARMTAPTRSAAFAPVTVRITKKDVPLAMLAGLMWGGSFNLALAAVINARLAALGSSESAKVHADLSSRRPVATVSIDEPPPRPPAAQPPLPVRRVGSVPGPEIIPMFATFASFANCYHAHRDVLAQAFAAALTDLPKREFQDMFGVSYEVMLGFSCGRETLPRTHAFLALKKILELAAAGVVVGPRLSSAEVEAALKALNGKNKPLEEG
jgi:hypothetical protein